MANWRKLKQFDAVLEVRNAYKSTLRLLGQDLSKKYKHPNQCTFNTFCNRFTPRLHRLKVNYLMNDESTLRDAGCFFDRSLEETVLNIEISFEEMVYCV